MNSYWKMRKKLLIIKFGHSLSSDKSSWQVNKCGNFRRVPPAAGRAMLLVDTTCMARVWIRCGATRWATRCNKCHMATSRPGMARDEISGRVQRACLSKHTRRSRAQWPTVFYTACADARRELWVQTFGDSVARGNVISTIAWMTRLLISMETSILRKYELRTRRSSVWTLPWPYVHHMFPEQLMSQFPATRAHCVVVYILTDKLPDTA